ncbi:phasin [Rhodopseudomonas sp. G2_2311]|uniref:phasin n=1 Tax=Rhodopseudomonas sp. G2_2311 TaxID=3114287 RepID=UPI0039C6A5D3
MTDTANHESYTQAAETVADSVKQAFQPVTDAFKNFQTLEVPEAARDFVRRAAGTAKEKVADFHAGSEKVTSAIEETVANSVSEAAKITRNIQQAIYQDTETFFSGIDKLASAKSVQEAFQIQTDLARSQGEVLVSRARSATEYFGKLVSDSAKSVQDNFAKTFSKSA